MVRMQAVPSPSIAITVELDGGIRNLACQDDLDETCYSSEKQQNCESINVPNNKSTELLTVPNTDRLELGAGVGNTVDPTTTSAGSQGAREKIMNACRSIWHWRLLVNAVIVVAVVVFMGVIELGYLPHQQIGFYCNDPGISFPFTGDTISISILLGGSVLLPLLVMWAAEWTCHNADSYRNSRQGCTGTRWKQIWSWYGHYTIGIVAVTCLCDFAKIIIGAPRPHFLSTCQPREWENCTDGRYIQTYTCTNTEHPFWFVMDASKSFPSGHSALSMFTSIYLIWYVQNRLPRRVTTTLLKPWVQCVILCWGIVCSLTRITDHRHHWWDVLAGIFIGIIASIYCVRVNCKGFILRDDGTAWQHNDPIENGRRGYDSQRHPSVKKLLSNTSVENREMSDIVPTWKE